MPRFDLGQRVLITGSITTKHRGREAIVISIQPNTLARHAVSSLDKYIVRFEEGDEADFYDVQLIKALGEADA